jgi:hypothetical protein
MQQASALALRPGERLQPAVQAWKSCPNAAGLQGGDQFRPFDFSFLRGQDSGARADFYLRHKAISI